jgi:hypothetical protein
MGEVTAKIGRPTAINAVVVVMVEHALKYGCSVAEACRYARLGRTTYYSELARNEVFAFRMSRAKGYLLRKAKLIISDALENNDTKTAMWYLERRDPDFR